METDVENIKASRKHTAVIVAKPVHESGQPGSSVCALNMPLALFQRKGHGNSSEKSCLIKCHKSTFMGFHCNWVGELLVLPLSSLVFKTVASRNCRNLQHSSGPLEA